MSLFWSLHCRDCFNCKQKVIKTVEALEEFTSRKDNEIRKGWKEKLLKNGHLEFYWCGLERNTRLRTSPPGRGAEKRSEKEFCSFMDN